MDVGSANAHRIEVLPDGSKLYTETKRTHSPRLLIFACASAARIYPRRTDLPGLVCLQTAVRSLWLTPSDPNCGSWTRRCRNCDVRGGPWSLLNGPSQSAEALQH
jgi:hypothetical protein